MVQKWEQVLAWKIDVLFSKYFQAIIKHRT